MLRKHRFWLPVILWMALIFLISTDLGSTTHTSRLLEPFLRWLNVNVSARTLEFLHFLIRKAGHMSGYAVLAALILRALRTSTEAAPWNWIWRVAAWAWLIAAGYAATDEFHQSFVPTRTASIDDVAIDSAGAALSLLVIFLGFKLHARFSAQKNLSGKDTHPARAER